MKKLYSLALLLGVLLMTTGTTADAQISVTPFKQFAGTWTPISGGTALTSSPLPWGSWDDGYWAVPVGFSFPFNGSSFTTVYVNTNGYISLGNGGTYISNAMYYVNRFQGAQGVISPFNLDSRVQNAFPITYVVTGSAPKRVLTLQFNSMRYWSANTGLYNYQVKLHETTGMIDFVYGPTSETGNRRVYVGIAGAYSDFLRRSAQQGTNTWDASDPNTTNFFGFSDFRPNYGPSQGLTYRFGCFVPDNMVSIQMVDAAGNAAGFFETPGTVYAKYSVAYPPDEAYDVTVTLNFYRIGDNSGVPAHTETVTVHKPVGTLTGIHPMTLALPPSYYLVEAVFTMYNNCLDYEDVITETSTLLIAPGTVLCEVWPGDVNDDGVVNYGDRKSLNTYIFEANLRTTWLNGPARFKIEAKTNPFVYYNWEPQPSVPWNTADGCYMDADGNGVVNNFDYLAIKMNWLKSQVSVPGKSGGGLGPDSFEMSNNYPNPFNPSTTISYSLPEKSSVTLVVSDMLGRTVATLVEGVVETGQYSATFDAGALNSGTYMVTVSMTGVESGLTFRKNIKILLSK